MRHILQMPHVAQSLQALTESAVSLRAYFVLAFRMAARHSPGEVQELRAKAGEVAPKGHPHADVVLRHWSAKYRRASVLYEGPLDHQQLARFAIGKGALDE